MKENIELKNKYDKEIIPGLMKEFGIKNKLQLPKLSKISINIGVGKFSKEDNVLKSVEEVLTKISGQKPVRRKAKKSISGFKVREGQIVGMSVTLRGEKMYSFLNKFLNVALPRMKDFRGINLKSIDKNGNLTFGLKEINVFPEVEGFDFGSSSFGCEVTIVVDKFVNKELNLRIFELLGVPFIKIKDKK